jgi:hypothetical protein
MPCSTSMVTRMLLGMMVDNVNANDLIADWCTLKNMTLYVGCDEVVVLFVPLSSRERGIGLCRNHSPAGELDVGGRDPAGDVEPGNFTECASC